MPPAGDLPAAYHRAVRSARVAMRAAPLQRQPLCIHGIDRPILISMEQDQRGHARHAARAGRAGDGWDRPVGPCAAHDGHGGEEVPRRAIRIPDGFPTAA